VVHPGESEGSWLAVSLLAAAAAIAGRSAATTSLVPACIFDTDTNTFFLPVGGPLGAQVSTLRLPYLLSIRAVPHCP